MSDELCGATKSPEYPMRDKITSDMAKAELMEIRKAKDHNGVSINMLNHAVAIFAEGFRTGQTDVRSLLYCVICDALSAVRSPTVKCDECDKDFLESDLIWTGTRHLCDDCWCPVD